MSTSAADPKWHEAQRVHDWRNHVPEDVQKMWHTFTDHQRLALYDWATELADSEHWD